MGNRIFNWLSGLFQARKTITPPQEDSKTCKTPQPAGGKTERNCRDIIELAMDGIFETGPDGRYAHVNPAGCKMLGYAKEEIIGKTAFDLVADEDAERLKVELRKFRLKGKEAQLITEFGVKRKDGTILPAEVSVKSLPDGRLISVLRDLSYRKKAEAALAASEQKFRSLVEGAYDSILIADSSGKIVLVNDQLSSRFGYAPAELVGQPVEILLPERYRTRHVMSRRSYSRDPQPRPMGAGLELYARRKDGSEFPVDISLSPVKTRQGTQVTAIIRDITERKRYEDQQTFLADTTKVIDETMDYGERIQRIADAIVRKIADTCVIRLLEDGQLNFKAAAVSGLAAPDARLIGIQPKGPFSPSAVIASGKPVLIEDIEREIFSNPDVDHDIKDLARSLGVKSYLIVPLCVSDKPVGTLSMAMTGSGRRFSVDDMSFVEIVANRCAVAVENARLYREAQRARLVADSMPAMLAYWDNSQRCRYANRAYLEWFGVTPENLLGRPISELLGKELYEKNRPHIMNALEGRPQFFERDLVMRATGEVRHTNAMYIPESAGGKVLGFFVLVVDVTALKRAQLAATSAKEKAEAAVKTREKVLAIVSHDLRNPLSSISLAAQVLSHAGNSDIDSVHDYAQRILRSAGQMEMLIGDLLDFAKIQSGTFSIERFREKPAEVILPIVQNFRTLAEAGRLRLEAEVPPDLPEIACDCNRVAQVLSNLLGNAVKFTPPGGSIRVSAEEAGGEILVSVSDTGPGIPEDQLTKVFDMYWQAAATRKLGSGLGLAIAKGIVEANGGKIWAESEPGQGARFFFTVPPATAETKTRDSAKKEKSSPGAPLPFDRMHMRSNPVKAADSPRL